MWLHKWGGLNILLCACILKNQNVYILGIWASWCIITIIMSVLQTDTVSCMVATSRLYVTVSYGSCIVAASDLYSTVSYGGAVQTPGAMCTCRGCTISQQNRVVQTSAFGCLNWAGSISFVRTFEEVPLGFSDFIFIFIFLSTLGIELTLRH